MSGDPFGPFTLPGYRETIEPFLPGGYLTLVSGSPVIASDQVSKAVVYYAQDAHNAFPVIKNGTRKAVYFGEPRLTLTSAHLASDILDVFGVERDGNGHIVTGPSWTVGASGSVTAGLCARGTGPGGTELTRAGGCLVNRWGMPGLNGDGSQFIPPGEGVYLGSLFIDGSNGQVTCHLSYGQSRKWGVWNAYNRKPIRMKEGDSTASWTGAAAYPTMEASNAASANKITTFCGLAEEWIDCTFNQYVDSVLANRIGYVGVGVNSTTAASGQVGELSPVGARAASTIQASHSVAPAIGINNIQAQQAIATGATFFGTEALMCLRASYRG